MSYPVIPSNLKNVNSVSLKLMSPEEMVDMSYGQVLTSETINYRTGIPQTNGLFCQAIFGPVKDWECMCGKYKRYRYAGVTCDKCGVMVAHSSVRRERMGHIDLAAPCIHPWYLRIIPSRIALLLDMKSADLSRICYFSAYVITSINEDMRMEYINRIDQESENRIKQTRASFDKKFDDLGKQFQIDRSNGKFNYDDLRTKFDGDKEIIKMQQSELLIKIETITEMARKELLNLEEKKVISENVHQEIAQKFGPVFKAEIGAEAVESLLRKIDLEKEYEECKTKLLSAKSQAKKKMAKKLKLLKHFLSNKTSPAWMVLHRIMVLPPDLRPMLQLDGGRFAASDLNDLYRRLINRNNRLRKLIQIGAPEVILRNEKRMLQEAVEALIDNTARNGKQVMASTGAKRPLKSLTDALKGKSGRFRQNLLGKRVDYSGRSVIIVGPTLQINECGLPKDMALELFKPFLIGRIISKSEKGLLGEEFQCYNIHSARRLIETKVSIVYDILDEVIKDKYVLLNRAPTLHRLGFLAFKPVLTEGKAIQIHPMVCKGFNADFDGDQMAVHVPITAKGQDEARTLMAANKNLLKPANGKLIMQGSQDIYLGAYYLTAICESKRVERYKYYSSDSQAIHAYSLSLVTINEPIRVRFNKKDITGSVETTVGRIIFNDCLPENYPFINSAINNKQYDKLVDQLFHDIGQDALAFVIDKIKDTMFKYVTKSGISISAGDLGVVTGKEQIVFNSQAKVTKIQDKYELGFLSENGKYKEIVDIWRKTQESILELTKATINPENNIGMMITSGARGNATQVNYMIGIRGLTTATNGLDIELPAVHGYLEGLSPLEYFISMKGHRKGMAGTALQTADAGYLTRRLVDVAQNSIVMSEDCGTHEGVLITKDDSDKLKKNLFDRIYGRYLASDVIVDGKVIAAKDQLIDRKTHSELKNYPDLDNILIRSVSKCDLVRGVCQKCYGIDFSSHKPVELGVAVGVIGAQSMGEPATQLAVGSVKHGVAIGAKSDITTGLPRVEEVLEARTPKYLAPMCTMDGVIDKIEGSLDSGYSITIKSISNKMGLPFDSELNTLATSVSEGSIISIGDVLMTRSTGEAVISSFDGQVNIVGNQIVITQETPRIEEYKTSPGIYLFVKPGQKVKKGQLLGQGALDLQTLIDVVGFDFLQSYIISELNDIYSNNGIDVDEKHIEVIIRQMTNRATILESGDSDFIIDDTVRLSSIKSVNKLLKLDGKKPAIYQQIVTGISRSSLAVDSFLSAASFQETARVLVEAALSSRKDQLVGLKENVILGQLIPCGTGFDASKIKTLGIEVEEFDELEMSPVEE